MNSSVIEPLAVDEDALVEAALPLLPEIGKLLYAAVARHPGLAGLSLPQIKALGFLHGQDGGTVGDLAAGLGVSMPSASELADRLVDAGLVARGANPADRRQVLLRTTPAADQCKAELRALRRAQVSAALARLDPAERPAFVRSLAALVEALRAEPGG